MAHLRASRIVYRRDILRYYEKATPILGGDCLGVGTACAQSEPKVTRLLLHLKDLDGVY